MNWVDFVILGILIIFICIGCFKGFVFSILSLFGTSVNFFISIWLCKPMTNLMNSIFNIETALSNSLSARFTNISNNFNTKLSLFESQTELSSHIKETINNSSLSGFEKKLYSSTIHITPENVSNSDVTLNNIISSSLSTFINIIISFIIVFLLIYLVLWILSLISKKANQISDIRLTDRILGVIFGFIKGSLIIVFVFAILSLFNENGLLSGLFEQIHNSQIGNWCYTNVKTFIDKYINFKEITKSIIDKI